MWFLDQISRIARAANQIGTGSSQDPTEFKKPQKLGRLDGYDVYTVQRRDSDYNYCFLKCKNQTAQYNRYSALASFGGPIPAKGVLLNRTTYEPIRYPYNSDGLPIIPEPSSSSCDDPRRVYDVEKFAEKVCNNSELGDKSHTVWSLPITPGKSCFGEYPPAPPAPTTIGPNITGSTDPGLVGPTLSPSQIAGVALAVGLVVAVPIAAVAIGLIQCYRSLRAQAPSEASSEITLEDALTFENDDAVSVSSEAKLLEKD